MHPLNFRFTSLALIIIWLSSCSPEPSNQSNKEIEKNLPDNVYITWAAHDQLSDTVKLSEELANKQLDAFLMLRSQGVKMDYFLFDMFWFSKNTLYQSFNETWPNGHEAFFKRAKENNVKLGMWLSANVLGWSENMRWLNYQDTLVSSINDKHLWLVTYDGVWPKYFNSVLEYWYGQGIRLFKIDFAAFFAAREQDQGQYTNDQIIKMNEEGFYNILADFRKKYPDCKFVAYNGFFTKEAPERDKTKMWREVYDAMFCGDPQPSLVPAHNFLQSVALYSDQMFWTFVKHDIPVPIIDNSQFMLSNTGTGHYRGKKEWKTMLISTLAKNSKFQTYYGNLDLLTKDDALWMSKAQKLFYEMDTLLLEGDYPYTGNPFLYHLKNEKGGLVFVVNSSQEMALVQLPNDCSKEEMAVQFSQQGFKNTIYQNKVTLAPEQFVLIGYGKYADAQYSLGEVLEGKFPMEANPVVVKNVEKGPKTMKFKVEKPSTGNLRFVFQLKDSLDHPLKIKGGSAPDGKFMGNVLKITALSDGVQLPVEINYDLQIWAGIAWAVGELEEKDLKGKDIEVFFEVLEDSFNGKIEAECYNTVYKPSSI